MNKQTTTIIIAILVAGGIGYWYYTNKIKSTESTEK
jgi:uncharacterized membrane protein YpjA